MTYHDIYTSCRYCTSTSLLLGSDERRHNLLPDEFNDCYASTCKMWSTYLDVKFMTVDFHCLWYQRKTLGNVTMNSFILIILGAYSFSYKVKSVASICLRQFSPESFTVKMITLRTVQFLTHNHLNYNFYIFCTGFKFWQLWIWFKLYLWGPFSATRVCLSMWRNTSVSICPEIDMLQGKKYSNDEECEL